MESAATILSIITLVCLMLQIHIQWRTMYADHERRKKQATIEYVNLTRSIYRPISRKLTKKFGEGTVININVIDEETKEDIKEFLSTVEHLAVGVNTKVYDLQILERTSGTYFIRMYNKLEPYISNIRHLKGNQSLYCEFQSMVSDIEKLREEPGKIRKSGRIKHS